MSDAHLTVIPGEGAVVLVAPHGGRRDPARHPWGRGRLRVNDLHTPDLTAELAARLDAPALINHFHDRNDVDLNRISEAALGAPAFLTQLHDLLATTLARHGRATLLTVHGWNVIQPALDLGLGCTPTSTPFVVTDDAAVSPAFAAGAVRRLVATCAGHGLAATVGARYPARHRENLLQLFTPRYRDDERSLVRQLAALAPQVDAVQIELGIPLRWPGPWRQAFLRACAEALPALTGAHPGVLPDDTRASSGPSASPLRFQFTTATLCGLAAHDGPGGARLLLLPPDGGLLLFTGEHVRGGDAETVGPLRIQRQAGGGCRVRFHGPLLRFADTLPFLDLEPGLAAAHLVDAEVALDFVPDGDSQFGTVHGHALVAGRETTIAGGAFCEHGAPPTLWPRLRVHLHLRERAHLALTLGLDDGQATGTFRRSGHPVEVASARVVLAPGDDPLARLSLDVTLGDGGRLQVRTHAVHRLPVVRGHGPRPVRIEFAACRLDDGPAWPAGWCELGGV